MKKREILNFALTLSVALSAAFAAEAAEPNTWWVNARNYIEGLMTPEEYAAQGFDGTTPEKGFGTIQIGIDKSSAGDTINVKEGVYDKGSTVMWSNNTRVVVDKNVTIVGVDGWEKTFIVGHQAIGEDGSDAYGNGPNAVRCVAAASVMRMSNFTICNGATYYSSSVNTSSTYCGGGIAANGSSRVFTDCMISNNVCARYGSGAYYGVFRRCRFFKNTAKSAGAATYNALAFACVFSGNNNVNGNYWNLENSGSAKFLNCTVVGNPDPTFGNSMGYNCLFTMNAYESKCNPTNLFATVMSTNGPIEMVAAPLGDFRLLPDAPAVGAADMKYLTTEMPFNPADEDGKIRDLNGNVIDTTAATLNAGACQEVVTPAYGGVLIDTQATINGMTCYGTNLTFATSWPVLLKVEPSSGSMFRYAVSGSAPEDCSSRYRGMDGILHIVPPYEAGAIQTNVVVANKNSRKAEEYATLDAVQTDYTSSGNPVTISVPEGDYATGGTVNRGVLNRISRTQSGWIAYTATGDVGKTIIRGAVASEPREDVTYPGCGTDAARCVNLNYSGSTAHSCLIFRGITFADGRTDCGQSADNDQGGAAYGRPDKSGLNRRSALTFMDCVFTNCWAPDAGVGVNAQFIRCKFIDCGSAGVGFKNCVLASCTFENCDFKGGTFGKDCVTVGCSDPSAQAVSTASGQIHLNSNFGFGTAFPASAKVLGATGAGFFADASKGDLRPISGSAALDAARRAFPEDADDFALCAAYVSAYATDSYDRREWTFGGDFPIAGAFMEWVRGCSFATDTPEAYTFAGGKVLQPGESVTIARHADAVRHYGLVANGVTNMLDTSAYVYTQPVDGGMNDGAIVGILDPNWYVNPDPTVGDDAANGFTPETAKWTLKGVLSVATNAGDIVHAAAGVYKDGTMHYSDSNGDARAIIKGKITLVGEGPEKSFIQGERCENGGGTYREGPGAMRCVMLTGGATVSGFTLTNGHSSVSLPSSGRSSKTSAYNGGAAWGVSSPTSGYLINCRIVDSRAYSGAAAFCLTLIGCTVEGTYGNYGAICYSSLYGCFVNDNRSGSTTAQVYRPVDCFDTTIGPKNSGLGLGLSVVASDEARIVNTLVIGKCSDIVWTNEATTCRNCAFVGTRPDADTTIASQFATLDDFKLDENYRPIPRESPLCGAADETILPKNTLLTDDVLAMRAARKLNGGLDIGVYEADWKSAYAQDIANRGLTVTTVSSDVVESADRTVVLGDGMSLSCVWNGRGAKEYRYELRFKVNGAGSLSVTVNGETRTFGSGVGSWSFDSALAANDISFAYAGDGTAEILKGARMSGLVLIVR